MSEQIETGSGNVYEDLGFFDAAEMQVKAQLATKIAGIIRAKHLTQIQASELLGIPQPKLSGMLRGQFRGISEAKMMECLIRLGRDVEIVVGKARRSPHKASLKVRFAG
ncbi:MULTISPECIES: helix-turn-helix domain-containing protein [Sodalis]|uniref:Putative XRE-type DNA-binding protein n=1 Tax=Sodalis ligni TaxID=2697027 RepID=A0A4R1NK25_9GAMM|nr:helix-turn-helix transcriptional regulator [Sodalis ligni]TCL04550.1 putative XRE-type DNA-binding protein [Sodalis ligni]